MAQQTATNTFYKGMVSDLNELDTANDILVNALNATTGTFNGNEGALQNDMGNAKINLEAHLKEGYIPIGSVEYGGVIYVASVNPNDINNDGKLKGEIGCLPSPNYNSDSNKGQLEFVYRPLNVGISNEGKCDLSTYYFNFDLEHPVSMLAELSFDGSVNLILNDGKNTPKLINTGFHAQSNGTYEIIKRFGINNTNEYNLSSPDLFNLSTSLYKDTINISNFEYKGTTQGGLLKVGNYVLYAITCDKDGNESDIIAESGVISIFKGTEGDPFSINGGISDEKTDKAIKITLTGIDPAYKYIKIYYTRTTAANNLSATTLAYKLSKLFPVKIEEDKTVCDIIFTGYETQEGVSIDDLNIQYFNADSAKALTISQNILFLGNVEEKNQDSSEYDELRKISLNVIPYCVINNDFNLKSDYLHKTEDNTEIEDISDKKSYYNSLFIYNTTGYHTGEIYRFGIVYIRQDNSLTSVFDVCGVNELTNEPENPNFLLDNGIDESKFYWNGTGWTELTDDLSYKFNSKGVCRIKEDVIDDLTDIIGISFKIPEAFVDSNRYKGYFFVRLKRIPTLLAQGYATNICEESFLPSINISKDDSCELEHKVTYTTEDASEVKTESNKLYLYESFVSGAFQTDDLFTERPNNFYPTRRTKKVLNTLKLVNNYRSRLFTLSDYTYLYLDKLLGDGPVSSFLNETANIDKVLFQAGGYDTIEYKAPNEKDPDEYLFVYYATPEKWDDKGYSDGSEGRTLLCAENKSNTDVNLYIHGFKKVPSPDKAKLLKIYFDVNEDDLAYNYLKETSDNIRYGSYITQNSVTGQQIRKDENGNDVMEDIYASTDHWDSWDKEKAGDNFLDTFCTENKQSGVNNNNNKGYVLSDSNKISFAASNKGSYRYTEILAMCLSPDKTYNAGLGLEFFCDTKKSQLYLYDGGSFYIPYCGFFGHSGHSWARSVDNIIQSLNIYIKKEEKKDKSDAISESLLLKDPTTPTFDGKYGQTNETDQDDFRIPLHTMEYGSYGVYCPEYELNQAHYNSIFTGLKLKILPITKPKLLTVEDNFKPRHYIYNNVEIDSGNDITDCKAIAVGENRSLMAILKDLDYRQINNNYYWPRSKTNYFSSKASDASEIGFKFVGGKDLAHNYFNLNDYGDSLKDKNYSFGKVNVNAPFNIVRGVYGPYVGVCSYKLDDKTNDAERSTTIETVDISDRIVGFYIPGYSTNNMKSYFEIRMDDPTPYQAISNRISINNKDDITCYRGDCYINWYTHRVNRNFNDSVAMYNDTIIDGGSFSQGFDKCFDSEYRTFDLTSNAEASLKFNIGDLNAVQLGSWVTFPIRSTINTALRSDDGSATGEVLACGHNKTFYPLNAMDAGGSYKISESEAFNEGFNKSGGERQYVNLDLTVWVNTYYKNRIQYSNVKLPSSLENGHRIFIATHFRDYTDQYGEIVKLIDLGRVLLVICEHGIFTVAINEQQLLAEGNGSNVFLNTNNVLAEVPNIVSDTYGSTWVESIIKTPYGVFGIDERSKKIWKTDGQSIQIISDNTILKFLNDHLYVTKGLKIGETNIKSHYNKYKDDVMFTLYDITSDETTPDLLWNLCYNIHSSNWQTFYSWIPIDSLNIGNNFVSLHKDDLADDNILHFWKHGQSERVPQIEKILPTHWYGQTHPFEFEFIVKEGSDTHKIFENMQIISNKTEPDSFHYQIVGESYDFSDLKKDAFYCLEKLKQIYSEATGLNISYDENTLNDDINRPLYNPSNFGKLISFPIYYARLDIKNQIYDNYKQFTADSYDYNYLTGTEIVKNELLNEYRLWNHTKAVDVEKHGLLRGNMRYKEDIWNVQINPIFYVIRNTSQSMWNDGETPLFLNDIKSDEINLNFPEANLYIDHRTDNNRKSIKLKDKYIKIRIRYTGKDLAVISAIKTLYTISYS